MADGNRTTVEVDLLVRQAKLLNGIHSLGCKSLVDLEEVNIIRPKARQAKHLGDGKSGANAHDAWGNTDSTRSDKLADDRKTEELGSRPPREKDGSSTIGYLRRVSGMGRPIFPESRLELGETLRGDAITDPVVCCHHDLLSFFRLGIHPVHLERHNLVAEAASLGGSCSLLERFGGKRVLLCPRDPVVRRDVFGGYAHGKETVL